MHNMALDFKQQGHTVTGSDDEIFEPSRTRLAVAGLLPAAIGWFPDKITPNLDAVILGMHARADNPELVRAQQLGLRIYSYPEFILNQSLNKTRVVIAGSHGKTTITSMILHVLRTLGRDFDYLVGAQVKGFDRMVRLSQAPLLVVEGDEYLASPIDRRPKFHLYEPHIALISGIAWDHVNVFPTVEDYNRQFKMFVDGLRGASLVFYSGDALLTGYCHAAESSNTLLPYSTLPHSIADGKCTVRWKGQAYPLAVFGEHNLQNAMGAMLVCERLGVSNDEFLRALAGFSGAAKRLETLVSTPNFTVLKDFAHSPSKVKATVLATQQQWPDRTLVACLELHTFSSLSKNYLSEYAGAMDSAAQALIYFNPETIAHKKLAAISVADVRAAFGRADLEIFTGRAELEQRLKKVNTENTTLLLMSSGNYGGIDLDSFAQQLVQR